jgi:hypothetical protein
MDLSSLGGFRTGEMGIGIFFIVMFALALKFVFKLNFLDTVVFLLRLHI